MISKYIKLLSVLLIFNFACSVKWADKLAERGFHKEAINDYQRGLKIYNRAIRFNKSSVLAYWRRSHLYYDKEMYDESIIDLNRAIEIDSTFNQGYLFSDRANAKDMLRDYNGAIKDYSMALVICKNDVKKTTPKENFFYYRADTYLQIGDTTSAIHDLDSALYYWNSFARAAWRRGQVNVALGQFEKAMKDYRRFSLDSVNAEFDYYADDFFYQGLAKLKTGDSTYCYDWQVAASHGFEKAIPYLRTYCAK